MGLDFTAIDFETANSARASVCSVGFAKVVNGRVVRKESWYVTPPTGLVFTNTFVHGITAADVRRAPTWHTTLERLDRIVGAAPVVAYSPFDKSVYNAANTTTGHTGKGWTFLDALVLARRSLKLDSHRLHLVAAHLALPPFDHHEAGADALACAQITLRLAELQGAAHTDELWPNPSASQEKAATRVTSGTIAPGPTVSGDTVTHAAQLIQLVAGVIQGSLGRRNHQRGREPDVGHRE